MRASLPAFLLLLLSILSQAQSFSAFTDSIRQHHHIPALGYAVVSSDAIIDIGMTGVGNIHTASPVTPDHQFRNIQAEDTPDIVDHLLQALEKEYGY
ncbi:hypothetical protein [Chitinophaga qingshengii]|uniref:Uncharacterized protein n=1 Tax=Chitinophaga qingshengii TaxID=1569794 RepID=A0ABR7TJ56_9BACT|nr:hypothetical protein [Chitinophaga qingshengii]MBC9929548.1 hypothetical protein [Chitinophaga qingshengii]